MSGHQHLGGPGMTQNQGNIIGDRPCVRQSRNYREHLGGNAMKELMGQDQLKWDTTRTQGAYEGGNVFDPDRDGPGRRAGQQQQQFNNAPQQQQQQQQQYNNNANQYQSSNNQYGQSQAAPQAPGHRRGAGQANRSTYNILSGQ